MGSCSSVPDTNGSKLHVILPISNPLNFRIREQRFQECFKKLQCVANINIIVVKLIYEDDILLKVYDKKTYVELVLSTTQDNILWSKENLINIGINYIKQNIIEYEKINNEEYKNLVYAETFIAWIDADIDFMSRSWVADAINELRLLETHGGGFIQLFSQANFLGPKNEIIRTLNSFCYQRSLGKTYHEVSNVNHDYWHPGFAWASTLNTLIKFNNNNNYNNNDEKNLDNYYLIDKTIGGADRHMAMSFLGQADQTVPKEISQEYRQTILDWQTIALHHQMKTSYIPGKINHYWHGDLLNRKYVERWEILAKNNFIPDDLIYRSDKLLIYRNNNPNTTELQKGIYQYFLERNEDSNVVIVNNDSKNHNHNNRNNINDRGGRENYWDDGRDNNYNNHNHNSTTTTDNHYPVYQGGGNHHTHHHTHHHHHHHDDSNNDQDISKRNNNHNDNGNSSWQGYG